MNSPKSPNVRLFYRLPGSAHVDLEASLPRIQCGIRRAGWWTRLCDLFWGRA
jgi:hypothetical protein